MLTKRILVLIFLIPTCVGFAALGGWYFAVFMASLLAVAGWEWANAFSLGNYRPSRWILTPGIILLVLSRQVPVPRLTEAILAACILAAMTVHLLQYEQGRDLAATDLMVTLGGLLYLGWLGGHFILLRALPDGMFWILLALSAVWFTDLGGFLVGRKWGKHKLSRRASPNKTWEGYAGGIVFAAALTPLIALLWQLVTPLVTPLHGLVIGLVVSILAPLGDLGESMIKRQFNLKDSSNLLPGHGGILDRIDSWLWAIPLAYYLLLLWL
jgi:phosphatidate cytidylyltransferase